MTEFLGDPREFIAKTAAGLAEVGIDRGEIASMDHICYRVETAAQYKKFSKKALEIANLVAINKVNGRDIGTYEFYNYLEAAGYVVPFLELPEPKPSKPYREGWEHVELVTAGTLKRFRERHPNLPFSDADTDKVINPELGLKVPVSMGMLVVKFHEQSIGSVAGIEQRLEAQGINYDVRNRG